VRLNYYNGFYLPRGFRSTLVWAVRNLTKENVSFARLLKTTEVFGLSREFFQRFCTILVNLLAVESAATKKWLLRNLSGVIGVVLKLFVVGYKCVV